MVLDRMDVTELGAQELAAVDGGVVPVVIVVGISAKTVFTAAIAAAGAAAAFTYKALAD